MSLTSVVVAIALFDELHKQLSLFDKLCHCSSTLTKGNVVQYILGDEQNCMYI